MKTNYSKFIDHLDESSVGVFTIAYYLYLKGLDVRIGGLRKMKLNESYKDFQDDGDLFVYKDSRKYRIEVKNLSCDFTCAEDWKFKDFIVCASHSYDFADEKPYAYFILNKYRTHVAIVNSKTNSTWNIVKRTDSRYNKYSQDFYTCDLSLIQWEKI